MNEGYRDILNSIGSSRPTPGGGSVAALSLAHAHSLATMVSRLTLKSDMWADRHEIANLIVQQSVDRIDDSISCLLYTSPSPRDKRQSRMPSSA